MDHSDLQVRLECAHIAAQFFQNGEGTVGDYLDAVYAFVSKGYK